MASYDVVAGALAAHDKTLGAGVVDTVTFVDDIPGVEVLSDGSAAIYFTLDGSAPTIAGAHCYKLPAGSASYLTVAPVPNSPSTQVKLISAGTPLYSVTRTP